MPLVVNGVTVPDGGNVIINGVTPDKIIVNDVVAWRNIVFYTFTPGTYSISNLGGSANSFKLIVEKTRFKVQTVVDSIGTSTGQWINFDPDDGSFTIGEVSEGVVYNGGTSTYNGFKISVSANNGFQISIDNKNSGGTGSPSPNFVFDTDLGWSTDSVQCPANLAGEFMTLEGNPAGSASFQFGRTNPAAGNDVVLSPAIPVVTSPTAPALPPARITNLVASDSTSGSVTITFTNAARATSHDLIENGTVVANNIATGYVRTVDPGTRTYMVRAINAEGSTDSASDSGTSAPYPAFHGYLEGNSFSDSPSDSGNSILTGSGADGLYPRNKDYSGLDDTGLFLGEDGFFIAGFSTAIPTDTEQSYNGVEIEGGPLGLRIRTGQSYQDNKGTWSDWIAFDYNGIGGFEVKTVTGGKAGSANFIPWLKCPSATQLQFGLELEGDTPVYEDTINLVNT